MQGRRRQADMDVNNAALQSFYEGGNVFKIVSTELDLKDTQCVW